MDLFSLRLLLSLKLLPISSFWTWFDVEDDSDDMNWFHQGREVHGIKKKIKREKKEGFAIAK